ncbi:MAG: hypothetical protein J1F22_06780 [Lachnospiraceae bacterium]|nr:hypothetical protein [Lachnospiraceae bacterium]
MKKQENEFELLITKALKGKKVPILILDSRWHALFPGGNKPPHVVTLEEQVNKLLKRQGFLVNELKDLKKTKKKLMDGIVAGIGDESGKSERKKDNQQRLLIEINERIQEESDELMGLPSEIKQANERLLLVGARYCFERLENGDQELKQITNEMNQLQKTLKEKNKQKVDLEKSLDSAYSLMHGLFGHSVMNLFDKGKL